MIDPERLYVDLIFCASKKYANWDPEVPVEVGDYGFITAGPKYCWRRKQGTFLKEGNIYTDGQAEKWKIPDPKEHGTDSSNEGQTWISSDNARDLEGDAGVGGQTPALLQCKVKCTFKVTSGQGAILVMDNESVSTINPPGVLRRLLKDESMKGRVIVSEAHKSSSFARLLTAKGTSNIAIGFSVEPPVSGVVSGSANGKWVRSSSAGNFKTKINKDGKRVFTPLFRLASLRESDVGKGMMPKYETQAELRCAEISESVMCYHSLDVPCSDNEELEEEIPDVQEVEEIPHAQEVDDPTENKNSSCDDEDGPPLPDALPPWFNEEEPKEDEGRSSMRIRKTLRMWKVGRV